MSEDYAVPPVEVTISEPVEQSSSDKLEEMANLLMSDSEVKEEPVPDVNGTSDYMSQDDILEGAERNADDKAERSAELKGETVDEQPEQPDSLVGQPYTEPDTPLMTFGQIQNNAAHLGDAIGQLRGLLDTNQISQDHFNVAMGRADGMITELREKDLFRREADINHHAMLKRNDQAIGELVPEWKDTKQRLSLQKELVNFLVDKGYTRQDITGSVHDPRTVKMAVQAMRAEQSTKQSKTRQGIKQRLKRQQKSREKTVSQQTHANTPTSRSEQLAAIAGLLSGN